MKQRARIRQITALLLTLVAASPAFAQQSAPQPAQPGSALLTLDTVFTYQPKSLGPVLWQRDGKAYLELEPSSNAKGPLEIVRYDATTGDRSVLVPAEKLTPAGSTSPLAIDKFEFGDDEQKLLIFTNSERVWRSNTRGDYWVLDMKTWELRRLGGDAK